MLISRTESKLQAVSNELEAANKIQTKIIAADFSRATEDTWDSISAVSAWETVAFKHFFSSDPSGRQVLGRHHQTDCDCPGAAPARTKGPDRWELVLNSMIFTRWLCSSAQLALAAHIANFMCS